MRAALSLALVLLASRARAADPAPAPPACECACPGDEAGEERTPGAPIDLNRATEHALVGLPGIGPARARAILAYRAEHGGFRSVSQLLHIRGIGRALLKQLRPLLTLGAREADPAS